MALLGLGMMGYFYMKKNPKMMEDMKSPSNVEKSCEKEKDCENVNRLSKKDGGRAYKCCF